jgi:hypothetical protein
VQCPAQWFNAYPTDGGKDKTKHYKYEPGQLLMHFAGVSDKTKVIGAWLERLERDRQVFELPLAETNYEQQISEFWEGLRPDAEASEKAIKKAKEEKERLKAERKKAMELKKQMSKEQRVKAMEQVEEAIARHKEQAEAKNPESSR